MKFCIDDANVEKIRRIYEYYPVDGVSTNPSILAKSGRDPYEVLKEIRSIIGEDGELFVQATAAIDAAIDQFTRDFQGLVGEGKTMADC
jgi:transaldolase